MTNKHLYTFLFDVFSLIFVSILSFLILFNIKEWMTQKYFIPLFLYFAIAAFYFRCIIFPKSSFLFSFWPFLVVIFLGNFYITFKLFHNYYLFLDVIDDYSIHFTKDFVTPLIKGLTAGQLLSIKSMATFGFVFYMVIIVLTQFRIIWLLLRKARAKFASKDSNY